MWKRHIRKEVRIILTNDWAFDAEYELAKELIV